MKTTNGFLVLITVALVSACGVQEDDKSPSNPPPSCGAACHSSDAGSPVADSGSPTTDAGSDAGSDAGHPAPDASTPDASSPECTTDANCASNEECKAGKCELKPEPPTPPTNTCNDNSDCVSGMECILGACVPVNIVPETPECDEDSDCASSCECTGGKCVPKGTPGDSTSPVISNVSVSSITATTVTVSWQSNEVSDENHVNYYRFDSDEVQLGFAVTASNGTHHTFTITHLSPSTNYEFYVTSKDAAGNVGQSELDSFTTAAMPTMPAVMPAPFRTTGANKLEFSTFYNNGSPCGEVLGNLPNMSWYLGKYLTDSNGDQYLEYSPTSIPNGNYEMSYIDRECGTESSQFYNLDWAGYGAPEMIKNMTTEARSFLYCNWYDAAAGHTVTAPDTNGDGKADPGCEIRITVTSGVITGRGNMTNAAL